VSLALSSVLNVAQQGRLIRCDVRQPGGATQMLRFVAAHSHDAPAILASLPSTRSSEFERTQGAQSNDSRELADAQSHLKSAETELTSISTLFKKLD
jgi:hypothetical protein